MRRAIYIFQICKLCESGQVKETSLMKKIFRPRLYLVLVSSLQKVQKLGKSFLCAESEVESGDCISIDLGKEVTTAPYYRISMLVELQSWFHFHKKNRIHDVIFYLT